MKFPIGITICVVLLLAVGPFLNKDNHVFLKSTDNLDELRDEDVEDVSEMVNFARYLETFGDFSFGEMFQVNTYSAIDVSDDFNVAAQSQDSKREPNVEVVSPRNDAGNGVTFDMSEASD